MRPSQSGFVQVGLWEPISEGWLTADQQSACSERTSLNAVFQIYTSRTQTQPKWTGIRLAKSRRSSDSSCRGQPCRLVVDNWGSSRSPFVNSVLLIERSELYVPALASQ